MTSLTVPDIIFGCYKEARDHILWTIGNDEMDRIILTVDLSNVPQFWYDCAETNISRDMERYYPWIVLRFATV